MGWVDLAQFKDKWLSHVRKLGIFCFHINRGESLDNLRNY